jgi:hypothetical protein
VPLRTDEGAQPAACQVATAIRNPVIPNRRYSFRSRCYKLASRFSHGIVYRRPCSGSHQIVSYLRVSTDKQGKSGLSREASERPFRATSMVASGSSWPSMSRSSLASATPGHNSKRPSAAPRPPEPSCSSLGCTVCRAITVSSQASLMVLSNPINANLARTLASRRFLVPRDFLR